MVFLKPGYLDPLLQMSRYCKNLDFNEFVVIYLIDIEVLLNH